jgi:NTP pyrophosphatase (non-canonical NTP hydrolase)
MQMRLIREEFHEFIEAHCAEDHGDDSEHTLKELADLVFVCYQYAVARNWNLDIAMKRVFESNMSKFVDGKPLRREDGKILKGPDYKPPFLDDLV